ncbi:B12-binding domain-containing radical SAM protein [Candidatus Poribacteria bacterium]|nr:B12-binding domain-containing radical SAM protein [Candidatus Poribacteria bacterium]
MKIILLTPTWSYSILKEKKSNIISDVTCLGILPPTGLLSIASALKSNSHTVKVIDGYFNSRSDILNEIKKINPALIGISVMSTSWNETCELSEEIKLLLPSVKIILGGHHINFDRENCLKKLPQADALVFGYGEMAMINIVKKLENEEELEKIYHSDFMQYFEPDFELLDGPINRYIPNIGFYDQLPFLPIFTTIGCIRNCAFCSANKKNNKFYTRESMDIFNEIKKYIKKYKIKTICFYDDCSIFETNRNDAIKLCQTIIDQKLTFKWSIYLTNFKLDKELLQYMKKAGCYRIHCAVESGVQKNRDYIRGDTISLSQIEDQINLINEVGIETYGRFMFGIFNETFNEGFETIKFAKKLNLDYASFIRCLLSPGTRMFDDLMKMEKINQRMNTWNYYNNFYKPYPMSNQDIARLIKSAYIDFYFRPSLIYNNVLKNLGSFKRLKVTLNIIKRILSDI